MLLWETILMIHYKLIGFTSQARLFYLVRDGLRKGNLKHSHVVKVPMK